MIVAKDNSQSTRVSEDSFRCWSAGRSELLHSSRDLTWTSLLLDHHAIDLSDDEYETVLTQDQAIAVMTRGEFKLESFNAGIWRTAYYAAGTVGLTPGGKVNRLRRRPAKTFKSVEMVKVYLPPTLFKSVADEYRSAGQRVSQTPLNTLAFNDPVIVHSVLAVLQAVQTGAPELYAETVAQWLATHLLTFHTPGFSLPSRERDPGYISDRRLARVLEFISTHYAERLTLDRLAQEAGISKYHFVKLFKQTTGRTPHSFVTQTRLEASKEFLLSTDMSIAEIAVACGYERSTHFATAFFARFGMTPSSVRDRRLKW